MTGVKTCALPICFPVTIAVGKIKPLKGNGKDIIFLPTDLANALKASPVYAPYINSLGDRMQSALDEMLANEEKYNIKNNDTDKSNI